MTSKERVNAVLAGRPPDRPPFSFWYHFPYDQVSGSAAVNAHLAQLNALAMDNLGTLVAGTPQQVREEVADALRRARSRPVMIAPGCTFDPARVPEANLHAIAAAVQASI